MAKPKIRFKGYTNDWEQRKVTDLGEIYIGLVTTMTEHYTDKGHLLIRNSDIKDGYFEFGENPIYLDEEFSEQNKSRMHKIGDVITVHTGDIGTSAVIGEYEVNSIGFATIVTRPNQKILDSNYFSTYLNTDTHKQWAISMATGDGRSNYNLKDYTKLVVPIPHIKEQKKIAACIVKLNNFITLHQRKCDQAKKLKKYMLQKMFPKNNESVPEIRFEGFSNDWEQRRLGELIKNVAKKNKENLDLEPYAVTNDRGFIAQRNAHDDFGYMSNVDRTAYNIVPPNSFAYNPARINVGSLGYYAGRENVIVSSLYEVFQTEKNMDDKFLWHWLKSDAFPKWIEKLQEGSVRLYFYYDKLIQCQMMVSTTEEQKKIGEYLDSLDHLITLHQKKCDQLKNLKKFMLQNMFV